MYNSTLFYYHIVNQTCNRCRLAHVWFLKTAFICDVNMHACVYVRMYMCVYVYMCVRVPTPEASS